MNLRKCAGMILFVVLISFRVIHSQESPFHHIYPLNAFKVVVDTCMRSYSDMLILQDRIAVHEKSDEQLDLLVGRLMRLQSYIEQLIYAYQYEATVSADELDYLLRMMEYLEVTCGQTEYKDIAQGLNTIISQFKHDLQEVLSKLSLTAFIPVPPARYQFPPLVFPSHRFA